VLRALPYAHPERVMMVTERFEDQDSNVSDGNYVDMEAQNKSFAQLAAEMFTSLNLAEGDAPERVLAGRVTHNFFEVFGVKPALGREFLPEEDQPGRELVAVLSHDLWTTRFGADPRLVGRPIRLGGREYTVLGVMPAGFDPTLSGERLWVPIAFTPERRAQHDEHHLNVVGLLQPGVSPEQASAEVEAMMRELARRYPNATGNRTGRARPMAEVLTGDYRGRLFILLGAVAFVLLIACGNVANLLLARGAARAKELAVRAALGAGRGRIARQLLTESVVLALIAAVVGVGLAYFAGRALVAAAPPDIPRLAETRIDLPVLAFALGAAIVSSLVFGLAPALRASRQNLQGTLREGGRGMGSARDAVRTTLVAAEVALALTLLTGAGLLIRTAINLQAVRPGFDPAGLVTARIALPQAAYAEPERVARTFKDIVDRLKQAPGVSAAAIVSGAPMGPGGGGSNGLIPEGRPLEIENTIDTRLRIVTPDYLATMRIPLKRGRAFTADDIAGRDRVMIVSEAFVRRAWPNEDPIGKRVSCCDGTPDDPRWKTVVGVAGDVRSLGPALDAVPEFYLPIDQAPADAWDWLQRSMTLAARGRDAATVTAAMRAAVRAVDPALPLYSISTMDDAIRASTAEARFHTLLLGAFGVLGLVLAAGGIYSVIAYFVSLRTHEIGVRMALGAKPADVVRLMTWQGLRPILIGVAVGTAAALATTRLLQGSLYGVSPADPLTLAVVAAGLVAVGLVATLIPASRATRVDPTRALQSA
jgi:putative ABC transport system permease protein